ncbi:MAG: hypothetical protein MI864_03250, partial [Pseudomonadales bacterium]|nr:hypothetical protein [Pseudomonadales bacterium]
MISRLLNKTNSLSTQILLVVFSIYTILVLVMTGLQMTIEYQHEKETVLNELKQIQASFELGFSRALWEF